MKEVNIEINGEKIKADINQTIIEVCNNHGIEIPSLCYHKKLL